MPNWRERRASSHQAKLAAEYAPRLSALRQLMESDMAAAGVRSSRRAVSGNWLDRVLSAIRRTVRKRKQAQVIALRGRKSA